MKRLKNLLTISALLFASPIAVGSDLNKVNQIVNVINDFKFHISQKDTKKIAEALVLTANRDGCTVSWDVLLSIAITESTLNRFAYNKKTKDHGLMQFNDKTIKGMHLNRARLAKDIGYSIKAACTLLMDHKRILAQPGRSYKPYWIGSYTAGLNFKNPSVVARAIAYDHKIKNTVRAIKAKYVKLHMAPVLSKRAVDNKRSSGIIRGNEQQQNAYWGRLQRDLSAASKSARASNS